MSSGSAGESVITLEDRSVDRSAAPPEPGLVVLFAAGQAQLQLLPLRDGTLVVGRVHGDARCDDALASRRHAEVQLRPDAWVVRDLGSRNGTFVDGERLGDAPVERARGRRLLLRIGATIYLAVDDLGPYRAHGVRERDGAIVGPSLLAALERVGEAGAGDGSLLILGESGAGKELAARSFHGAGAGGGERPFIAVNCAAIPDGVAERLLFGSVRGAFSGATDALGYIQAAHGGTLFLDEVGELAPTVQAKLLRVLETGELLPLGATRPVRVSTRFCFATLRNLRALVEQQRFRADLFYRIARTTVTLPPLRERADEIAALVMRELALAAAELSAHGSLIEACLLRPWPGNVRELQSAVRYAVAEARRDGKAEVRAAHLPPLDDAPLPMSTPARVEAPRLTRAEAPGLARLAADPDLVTPEALRAALAGHRGNLAAAARALGLHRSQMYRLMTRHAIERDR